MTHLKGSVKTGEYFDSVTLMMAARELRSHPGVIDAAIVMSTKENKAILEASGLMIVDFRKTGESDLIMAVKTKSSESADLALKKALEILKKTGSAKTDTGKNLPRTLDSAVEMLPGANMAVISVAGRYAGNLAMTALEK